MGNAPECASEALDMVRAGLGYLAAADAAQLSAAMQAECLRGLERAGSVLTAARASMLAEFTAGQGYADDAAYSARSWLIHQTHITSGAAVSHTAWAKRAAVGLDPGPEPRRHQHRVEQEQDQGPPQPRTPSSGRVTALGQQVNAA
jgi:hypothetical protein